MNAENPSSTETSQIFWPSFFLTLAFIFFLLFQLQSTWNATNRLHRQKKELVLQQEQALVKVARARTMQTLLHGLANDLLNLAKTDSEIGKIVDKYQIRWTNPQTSPPPPVSQ